jgi:hypothetical protein
VTAINIDITGWQISTIQPGCYCDEQTLYMSPVLHLAPGNSYNLGSLDMFWYAAGGPPPFPDFAGAWLTGDYYLGRDRGGDPINDYPINGTGALGIVVCFVGQSCDQPPDIQVPLITAGLGDMRVVFWAGTYNPPTPTPLPDTASLLAVGLIGLAVVMFARRLFSSGITSA